MEQKHIFVFKTHSCNNEGQHVQDRKTILSEFGSIVVANDLLLNFSKKKLIRLLHYDIWYIKTEKQRLD